jgi:hypothetical protein
VFAWVDVNKREKVEERGARVDVGPGKGKMEQARLGRAGGRERKEKGRLSWAAWNKKKRGERRWTGPRGEKER